MKHVELFTFNQIMTLLEIPRNILWRLINQGKLKPMKLTKEKYNNRGIKTRFLKDDVVKFLSDEKRFDILEKITN